jgi:hypothetical protein
LVSRPKMDFTTKTLLTRNAARSVVNTHSNGPSNTTWGNTNNNATTWGYSAFGNSNANTSLSNASASLSPSRRIHSETLSKEAYIKPIIFPEFQQAATATADQIWIDNLLLAARGEFIARVAYDGTNLLIKDQGIRVRMPKDPFKLANAFIKFHNDHLGRLSSTQTDEQNRRRMELAERKVVLTWSGCNKRMKRRLLAVFAEEITTSMGLDAAALKLLTDTLYQGLNAKLINIDNVTMDSNRIQSIDALRYDQTTGWWWFDAVPESKPPTKVRNSKEPVIHQSWSYTVNYYYPTAKTTTTRRRKAVGG